MRVFSAAVGTRSSRPSQVPIAVQSLFASTARTLTPTARGQCSGPGGAIDHRPSIRRCERSVNGFAAGLRTQPGQNLLAVGPLPR